MEQTSEDRVKLLLLPVKTPRSEVRPGSHLDANIDKHWLAVMEMTAEMDHTPLLEGGQVFRVLSQNHEGLKRWDCGLWSETEPPAALRDGLREPQRYLQAMRHINKVHRKKVWFRSESRLNCLLGLLAVLGTVAAIFFIIQNLDNEMTVGSAVIGVVGLYFQIFTYKHQLAKRILRVLQSAVGGANALLWDEDVLIGCESNTELLVVRVPLSACRENLGRRFDPALKRYSCAYACSLAQRDLESDLSPKEPGHLGGAPCFCQFVLAKSCCFCCCCYC